MRLSIAVPGTVPDVTGMTLDAARTALQNAGYRVGNVAITQQGDEGKVVRTEPEANATLHPGEAVTIYYNAAGCRALMRILGVDPGLAHDGLRRDRRTAPAGLRLIEAGIITPRVRPPARSAARHAARRARRRDRRDARPMRS